MSSPWQPQFSLTQLARFYASRAAACGYADRLSTSYCQLRPGATLVKVGRRPNDASLFEARPFRPCGSHWFAVLPTTSVAPLVQPAEAPAALQGIARYIRVAGGAQVPLGQYYQAVRLAIAHPNQQFNQGLTTWWPVIGAEIRRQFRASIHDRINQAIPWILRC